MSTRCNVRVVFDGEEKLFYRHHDGYPSGVGKELVDLTESELSDDPSEKDFLDFCAVLVEDYGHEEVQSEAGDIEWYYEVSIDDHRVTCYSVDWRTGAKLLVHRDLAATGDFD